jgi:hypothetical protein
MPGALRGCVLRQAFAFEQVVVGSVPVSIFPENIPHVNVNQFISK